VTPSIASLWIVALAAAAPAAGDDPLAAARDLYVAAQYREALDVLAQADVSALEPASQPLALEYRALCLLALNREQEGIQAFEALVQAQPAYDPAPDSLSPRIRTLFDATRRRLLPGLAQARFADARAAFDRGEYVTAASGFQAVHAILAAARAAGAPADGGLADLAVLADGFGELATSRVGPAPARRLDVSPAPAPSVALSSPPASAAAPAAGVIPPVVVRQDVPRWPPGLVRSAQAAALLEVQIDRTGAVTDARVTQSLNPVYDQLLIDAARGWRYKPALRGGQPTAYVKILRLELAP
jgi:TonB family protein